MKQILVISDIHGSGGNLSAVLEKEEYTDIIFCGDGMREISSADIFPDARRYFVRGNADRHFFAQTAENLTVGIHGKLFFITHGDEFNVKNGTESLEQFCIDNYIDIAVFGHTHDRFLKRSESGLVMFNPGPLNSGSYGVIDWEIPNFDFVHKKL